MDAVGRVWMSGAEIGRRVGKDRSNYSSVLDAGGSATASSGCRLRLNLDFWTGGR